MPSIRNIFVTPNVRLSSWPEERGRTITHVQVSGLLCNSLCVRRVKTALGGLAGVSEVKFDPRSDAFALQTAATLAEEEVRRAVLEQVVFPRLREFLGSTSCLAGIRGKVSRRALFRGPASKAL